METLLFAPFGMAAGAFLAVIAYACELTRRSEELVEFHEMNLHGAKFSWLARSHAQLAEKGGRDYCRRAYRQAFPMLATDFDKLAVHCRGIGDHFLLTTARLLWHVLWFKARRFPGKNDMRPLIGLQIALVRRLHRVK